MAGSFDCRIFIDVHAKVVIYTLSFLQFIPISSLATIKRLNINGYPESSELINSIFFHSLEMT